MQRGLTRQRTWRWWPDAIVLGLGALAVRLPAMFAPTQLGYDDGGYGLAVVSMRQGYSPFRDIFSPQGPLFLPALRVADVIGLEHRNAPRLLPVLAGIVVTLTVYWIGVRTMDRGRALLAGAITAASGVLLWTTGPMTGDGPAGMFAVLAVAVAVAYRDRPRLSRAVGVTVLAGLAVSTKSLLVGPALAVALAVVASRRRWPHVVLVPVGAFAIVTLLSLPWGVGNVVNDYVRYHLDKTTERDPLGNVDKILTTFWSRDPFLVVLLAIALVLAVVARIRGTRAPRADTPRGWTAGTRFLWWWAALAFVVLVVQFPMFRNHISALVAPLALLAACYRPPWTVVAVAALVTLPFQAAHLQPLLWPHDFSGREARIVDELRTVPDDAWVLSDTPGLVWRAGRATNPFYVDPSVLRLDSHVEPIKITEDRLVRAASDRRVCAVAVTAPVRFGRYEDLPDRLAAFGYRRALDFGDRLGVYTRADCGA